MQNHAKPQVEWFLQPDFRIGFGKNDKTATVNGLVYWKIDRKTPYVQWEQLWFPVDFPLNQSIAIVFRGPYDQRIQGSVIPLVDDFSGSMVDHPSSG